MRGRLVCTETHLNMQLSAPTDNICYPPSPFPLSGMKLSPPPPSTSPPLLLALLEKRGAICAAVLTPLFALLCCGGAAYYYRRRRRGARDGARRLPRMGARLTQLKSMRSAGGITDEDYWRDYQARGRG